VSGLAGRRIIVATENNAKLREIAAILRDISQEQDFDLGDLSGFARVDFPEEGADYAANAIAKARAAAEQLGEVALSDDSGLEVEGLGGAPGPLSARFGGPGLDDSGRVELLLARLAETPGASRRGRFVCTVALAIPNGRVETASGECAGTILTASRGQGGFGYDPVFQVAGTQTTMSELPARRKNEISHRARALRKLFESLRGDRGDR
jgi:XTP/dITP diphosphohydrolase